MDIKHLLDQTGQSVFLRPIQREKLKTAQVILDVLTGLLGGLEEKEDQMKGTIDDLVKEKSMAQKQINEAEQAIKEQMRTIQRAEDKERALVEEIATIKDKNAQQQAEL